jgi:RNA methyltransferase, TrmH family
MVSKNQIKFINKLKLKRERQAQQMFFAEGVKTVQELIDSHYELHQLFTTKYDFLDVNKSQRFQIETDELKKISALATPNTCLAVFKIPQLPDYLDKGIILVVDDVKDPGNLGTIIRLCDWFGITQLVCSAETVDVYNPKVIQGTMGSISRVNVFYKDLEMLLNGTQLPILGTYMDGENIYKINLPKNAIVILGNEANGISDKITHLVNQKISIPRFGIHQKTESLNVANVAAIILSEFSRG